MKTVRKALLCMLPVLFLWTNIAGAAAGGFSNVFYAISSYSERVYTAHADQTALGWAEIRKHDGHIYFSQQRVFSGGYSEYGVPVSGVPALIKEMKAQGTRLNLSVFLDDRAGGVLRELLDSPMYQQQIVSDMVEALQGIRYYDYNAPRNAQGFHPHSFIYDDTGKIIEYDGIIIDFEQLFDQGGYRQKFNQFLQRLKDSLPPGKTLTVCIPPKRKAPITYFDGYDYAYIGKTADEVILMAHNYESRDGSIRATAPIAYVREALEFAVKEIPREKVLLQVSLAPVRWENGAFRQTGYGSMLSEWNGQTEGRRLLEITPVAQRYNDVLQSGYVKLKQETTVGTPQQIEVEYYFEDPRSIARKRALAGEMGIKGLSVWRLGLGGLEPLDELLLGSHIRGRVEGFVKRLYTVALAREAEAGGLTHYTDRLITRRYTAAQVVQFMLLEAPEFLNKNLSSQEFVEISYRTFFDRTPDPEGRAYWLKKLDEGYSKQWVIANMLGAPTAEFDNLCRQAGILTGRIGTRASDLPGQSTKR